MHIRSLLRTGFAAAFLATSLGAATSAFATQDNQQTRQGNDLSGLHAFDSRVGCWTFHNRVLRERLAHSHDWFEYDARQRFWLVMGGYPFLERSQSRTKFPRNGGVLTKFNPPNSLTG